MITNTTRRGFLSSLIYLGLFRFMQSDWNLGESCNSDIADALTGKLANFYVDKESAKIVGREYLQSLPSEANIGRLTDLICSTEGAQRAAFTHINEEKLRQMLIVQQRRDFEEGRVASVRGWILSRTECRLCALVALL